MTLPPLIPDNAPFTAPQRAWLNGFLAGWLGQHSQQPASSLPSLEPAAANPLLILFGSQSGNAESLAKRIGREAKTRGFQPRVSSMDAVQPKELETAGRMIVVTSTWGEGEMPDNAKALWHSLSNGSSPNLSNVEFSVLALGDKNYGDTFCQAGKEFDRRLEELGAKRVHGRAECDVDFEETAAQWIEDLFGKFSTGAPSPAPRIEVAAEPVLPPVETGYSRKNPFPGALLQNRTLNGEGSAKDVRHIVFSLEGSGLSYEPGDALGVFPKNCPEVVDAVLACHGLDGSQAVPLPNGETAPLRQALIEAYEVRGLLGKTVEAKKNAIEFVEGLRKLNPRLYSIASSLKAHPNEVHLTVGAVRYEKEGVAHKGVCSTFLADRLPVGQTAGLFIQVSHGFRLPSEGTTPIIMVGPGTGIAPFRAFLEERMAAGAKGANWLFFGDQHAASDFLYREEIERYVQDGILSRLDTAFSRDQAEKIYVQNRMLQSAKDLWAWLESGAHFYVCGDASRMAKDVDQALRQICRESGGLSEEAADEYIKTLREQKRYQRDVY